VPKKKAKKARRTKLGKSYVTRTKDGKFKKFTSIGKSLAADRRKKAKNKPKGKGMGNTGDYSKKRSWL